MVNITEEFNCIYGPENSFRFGNSLGVDLICKESTCSFNCIYCQLGNIINKTSERQLFVDTDKVIHDFKNSRWQEAETITFCGSGEPTLALNLGEVIKEIKLITDKPIIVLTNSTLLNNPDVIKDLKNADQISAKLDSVDDRSLFFVNRPVSGITYDTIIDGIQNLRNNFSGKLSLQTMIMPSNKDFISLIIKVINKIKPDQSELNLPTRDYPFKWEINNRTSNLPIVKSIPLRKINLEKLKHKFIEKTGIPVITA